MTFMLWGPALEIGIPEVDSQHRKLVGLVNTLDSAVKRGYSVNILDSILTELMRYTLFHFTFEERLMETHHLDLLAEHQAEHQRFADTVTAFKVRFDTGRTDIGMPTLAFLRDWLTEHILGSDRAFATEFLAATAGPGAAPAAAGSG
ncbi:MAG: bacteriohemerythrin [Austwickia sp.]|nr:bacteriohemerythrin [Actinomycetota bacterium]MCB1254148.1 hemerythrin family protein [Austwickia sp.]MCO5310836.1 bacteriohemerythrin [Austwickia sp.]